jgi:hypothetical protein
MCVTASNAETFAQSERMEQSDQIHDQTIEIWTRTGRGANEFVKGLHNLISNIRKNNTEIFRKLVAYDEDMILICYINALATERMRCQPRLHQLFTRDYI